MRGRCTAWTCRVRATGSVRSSAVIDFQLTSPSMRSGSMHSRANNIQPFKAPKREKSLSFKYSPVERWGARYVWGPGLLSSGHQRLNTLKTYLSELSKKLKKRRFSLNYRYWPRPLSRKMYSHQSATVPTAYPRTIRTSAADSISFINTLAGPNSGI